jgi:hypothetical protein
MIVPKNNREESQKLFSTGNSELDDLLTEVYFSGIEDGYDYAQKEFAEKSDNKSTAAGVTLAGASGGALIGNKIANKRVLKKANKQIEEIGKEAKEKILETEKKHFRIGRGLFEKTGVDKEGQRIVKGIEAGAKESTNKVKKAAEETIKRGNRNAKLIAGAGLTAAGIVTTAGALKRKSNNRNEQRA